MSRKHTWLLAAACLIAVGTGAALWIRRSFVAITVDGFSMSPALYPGDKVLIRRGISSLRTGRIAVLARPNSSTGWRESSPASGDLDAKHWYIKRVVAVAGDPYPPQVGFPGTVPSGHVAVLGDHPRSEDSKQHGPCPVDQILGIQVRKLAVYDDLPVKESRVTDEVDGDAQLRASE